MSQVQLLTSRDLIRRVAEKNKLADLPEFDGSKIGMTDALLQMLGLGRDPLRVSPEERVIDIFLEKLLAFRSEGSRVLVIQFTSTDRELAARVANSLAEEYLRMQSEAKQQTSKDQTTWLGEEIAKLQVKVREAESAVERYRAGQRPFCRREQCLGGAPADFRHQQCDCGGTVGSGVGGIQGQAAARSPAQECQP